MGSPTMRYQCSLRSKGNVGAYASTPEPLGAPDPARGARAAQARALPHLRRRPPAWRARSAQAVAAGGRAPRRGAGARGPGRAPGSACAGRVSVSRSAHVTMSFSDTSLCSSPSTCAPGQRADPALEHPYHARPSAGAAGLPHPQRPVRGRAALGAAAAGARAGPACDHSAGATRPAGMQGTGLAAP